jgi:hypothetical protein
MRARGVRGRRELRKLKENVHSDSLSDKILLYLPCLPLLSPSLIPDP